MLNVSTHVTLLIILLWTLRCLAALAVTLHVLRTKQDSSVAVGWIGISFFMPLTGAALYAMFGINRVRRLAKRLVRGHQWDGRGKLNHRLYRVSGQFAPLARMVALLTDRPLLGGNCITCSHNGDENYPKMLAAIDKAERTVLLCSYIFRDDAIGEEFVDALSRAQARGVIVRVLIDGIGSGYFWSKIARTLKKRSIPCHRFMHSLLPWRMPFINLRNHRKLLVVDGKIGFMGGLNIGDENILKRRPQLPVADTHFMITGPIVHQLTEAFAHDWSFTCGEELKGNAFFPEVVSKGTTPLRIVTAGPDSDLEKIEFTILQALTLARKNVRLMTPYFLPSERLTSELCLAALRGVEIDIVIPKRSNHRFMDYARDASLAPFLKAGCHVWLAKPPFNHAKLLVIDGAWSFVGSSNMDARSLRLNFEINLEVYDADLAGSLTQFIDAHKSGCLSSQNLARLSYGRKLRNSAFRLFMPYL